MASDLKERQRSPIELTANRDRPRSSDARWPDVATWLVLAILVAVTLLVLAKGGSRPSASAEQWQRNVEGMLTSTREGSGSARIEGSTPTQPSRRYANGALENEIREATAASSDVERREG
ncbi:MAG: hypothetical protein ACRDGO_10880 [Actinomycetota bacterium]